MVANIVNTVFPTATAAFNAFTPIEAFLASTPNCFVAAIQDDDGEILRQYKNGIKIAEFPLDNGEYATAAVSTGNKIFASVVSGGQYKLKIWEVNQ